MNSFEDKNLKRIADALERLIPSPINLQNLNSSNLFVWKTNPDQLINLENNNLLTLEMLIGINNNKKILYNNTLQFAKGFPANNVLLWGARGTGKSSLVKLIHNKISSDYNSLKLIQVKKEDIPSLDRLLSLLQQTQDNYNFIIYCDDLSFSDENDDFKILKVLLDGGLIEKPRNVIFYCTSNRKHLIPRDMSENVSSSISPTEEVEEKVSLSDRFGLILGFYPFSQDQFFEMIINYKNNYKIPISDDETIKEAIEWQQTRGARSGRVAWQFILFLAGKYEVNL
ncbi:MAG: ATPase [Rhodobacterales bacterium]|nr:MAG: ATPase [Rhodobacterales bacterium]